MLIRTTYDIIVPSENVTTINMAINSKEQANRITEDFVNYMQKALSNVGGTVIVRCVEEVKADWSKPRRGKGKQYGNV